MEIATGGWVRFPRLFPGIWEIADVIHVRGQRWSLAAPPVEEKSTLILCHRFVNDAWKRSFSQQVCDVSWASALDGADSRQLEALRSENSKLQAAFEKYKAKTKPLDAVANVGFGGMQEDALSRVSQECDLLLAHRIDQGITLEDFLVALQGSHLESYMSKMPLQRTLQLICSGHELRDEQYLYRSFRVLPS